MVGSSPLATQEMLTVPPSEGLTGSGDTLNPAEVKMLREVKIRLFLTFVCVCVCMCVCVCVLTCVCVCVCVY